MCVRAWQRTGVSVPSEPHLLSNLSARSVSTIISAFNSLMANLVFPRAGGRHVTPLSWASVTYEFNMQVKTEEVVCLRELK